MTGADQSRTAALDEQLVDLAKDALYVTVGFGVLAVQRLQVRRRELLAALDQRRSGDEGSRPCQLDDRVDAAEARLDEVVGKLQDRLPDPAGQLVGHAHDAARTTRSQLRSLARRIA